MSTATVLGALDSDPHYPEEPEPTHASVDPEYHHLMNSYLKDPETMRHHLEARGVTIPAKVPQTG